MLLKYNSKRSKSNFLAINLNCLQLLKNKDFICSKNFQLIGLSHIITFSFFCQVVPVFEKFIESKGQRRLLCIPTCFSSMSDGENDYIALQDVSVHGYGPVSRLNCLDLEQMNLLLKAMADFHAISFAYKDQNTDKFQQLADKLVETYFGEEFWYCYKNYRVCKKSIFVY